MLTTTSTLLVSSRIIGNEFIIKNSFSLAGMVISSIHNQIMHLSHLLNDTTYIDLRKNLNETDIIEDICIIKHFLEEKNIESISSSTIKLCYTNLHKQIM